MDNNMMKNAADIGLPGGTFLSFLTDATVVMQFFVAALTVIWIGYRLHKAWVGSRPNACAGCPRAVRDLE